MRDQPDLFAEVDDRNDEAKALVAELWKRYPSIPRNPTDTQVAAAEKIKHTIGSWRARVLALVVSRGERGCTGWEAIVAFGGPMVVVEYTIRPCFTDLKDLGLVADSGNRRENARGNPEIVWVARGEARRVAEFAR